MIKEELSDEKEYVYELCFSYIQLFFSLTVYLLCIFNFYLLCAYNYYFYIDVRFCTGNSIRKLNSYFSVAVRSSLIQFQQWHRFSIFRKKK